MNFNAMFEEKRKNYLLNFPLFSRKNRKNFEKIIKKFLKYPKFFGISHDVYDIELKSSFHKKRNFYYERSLDIAFKNELILFERLRFTNEKLFLYVFLLLFYTNPNIIFEVIMDEKTEKFVYEINKLYEELKIDWKKEVSDEEF